MKTALKIVGSLLLLVLLFAAGTYLWAGNASKRILTATHEAHAVDFPIPFPLSDTEIAELGIDADAAGRVATERAVERGRHLVNARYACMECHGTDFSGGVMVDAFPIGTLLGPNLTAGAGSKVRTYTAAQWDRAVRHGILPDGRPSIMPSEDFRLMSDQELSDIVAYIRSHADVDNAVPAPVLGPLGKVLMATGQFHLSVNLIGAHDAPHPALPPATEASVEFGAHLAATCMGCHRQDLSGGPIVSGDPSWPPARNLTPHPAALGPWSYTDFVVAMQQGTRPDGTKLLSPMTLITPYAQKMTAVELEALWMYLQSLPAVEPTVP